MVKNNKFTKTREKDSDEHYDRRSKNADEFFCYSCGALVKKGSNLCPKCGVVLNLMGVKDKSVAIFLAIFTSFFTWLYLYEKNSIKFWIGLIISIIGCVIFTNTENFSQYIGIILIAVVWIFSIFDVSLKNKDYYQSFRG